MLKKRHIEAEQFLLQQLRGTSIRLQPIVGSKPDYRLNDRHLHRNANWTMSRSKHAVRLLLSIVL